MQFNQDIVYNTIFSSFHFPLSLYSLNMIEKEARLTMFEVSFSTTKLGGVPIINWTSKLSGGSSQRFH